MKLIEHFDLEEFVQSETASARGIDNTPTDAVIAKINCLHENIFKKKRK